MFRIAATFLAVSCLALPAFSQKPGHNQEPENASVSQPTSPSSCGEPYCAESSRKFLPEHAYVPPQVNRVFRDPEFSSRMVRVTDENGIGGTLAGFSFISNSSAEINEWGKFDPSLGPNGGYYFYVMTGGGGSVVFSMDASTMQITPHCDSLRSCRLPSGGTFSYVDPHIIYGHFEDNNLISSYNVANGKESKIYDLSKCPNLPRDLSGYPGAVANSGDDTKFSSYSGGRGQGGGSLVTYYDRSSGHCYWYDTGAGRVGGSEMATTQLKVGMLPPPPAPNLASTSGTLPPGDYYVEVTVTIHRPTGPGESLPSPESHIRLDSSGGIQIAAPEVDNPYSMQVMGYHVYIGTAPGEETQQSSVDQIRSGYTQSSPLAKGSRPPATSSAGFNVHNARISRDGSAVKITPQGARSIFIWMPGTTNVSACTTAGVGQSGVASYCGGHTVLGYSHLINQGGPGQTVGLLYRPLSDLTQITKLIPAEDSMPLSMDTHWSWNNDNPTDTAPVCGAFSGAGHTVGDGTRNPATNPLLAVKQAWDREIVCVATSGPPKVWRFAHHHATGACNASARIGSCFGSLAIGNVSQDGRFYLFSSDWDWSLGSEPRSPGCPTSGRCRADVFIVELK
jgi:hypothetical protein